MWTDLETHDFGRRPEEDPMIGRYLVILLLTAAIAAVLVGIYVAVHSPLFS